MKEFSVLSVSSEAADRAAVSPDATQRQSHLQTIRVKRNHIQISLEKKEKEISLSSRYAAKDLRKNNSY